jgi:hypothetical protein
MRGHHPFDPRPTVDDQLWRIENDVLGLPHGGVAHFSHAAPVAAQERAMARLRERVQDELKQGQTVVHVHDGKPLTEHGAKMLGLPWPAGGE